MIIRRLLLNGRKLWKRAKPLTRLSLLAGVPGNLETAKSTDTDHTRSTAASDGALRRGVFSLNDARQHEDTTHQRKSTRHHRAPAAGRRCNSS